MFLAAGIVAVVIALAVIIGIHPRGGRLVANTQMMTVARVVLVVVAVAGAVFLLGFRH